MGFDVSFFVGMGACWVVPSHLLVVGMFGFFGLGCFPVAVGMGKALFLLMRHVGVDGMWMGKDVDDSVFVLHRTSDV